MSLPKIGNLAPAFSLLDQNGDKVSLKDFRGKKNVVIYFYPKAMTPGCTTQACSLRDNKKELAKLKTVVLGISPDDPVRLKKFEDKEELNFTLLSDPDHKIASKYGAWGRKKFMGKEYDGILRQTYIVDKQGALKHIMTKFKTSNHHDEVIDYLKENL